MFIGVSFVIAQDEYHKVELSGGYSSMRGKTAALTHLDPSSADPVTERGENHQFNDFDASVRVNFTQNRGVKFATSGHFASAETILRIGVGVVFH